MAEGKNGDGAEVRVTVRISIPSMGMKEVPGLAVVVGDLVESIEGATYDLSMSSPRPERPR